MGEIYIYRRHGYSTPLKETTSKAKLLLWLVCRALKRDVARNPEVAGKEGVLGWRLNVGDKGDRKVDIGRRD